MQIISQNPSENITLWMLIGLVECTVASNYTGNMIRKEELTSPCQIILPTPSMNSNTHIQKYPDMHHKNGNAQTMDQKHNGPNRKVHQISYQNIEENESKKWWEDLYTMAGKLTQRYQWHLYQSQQSKQKEQHKQRMRYNNFQTTLYYSHCDHPPLIINLLITWSDMGMCIIFLLLNTFKKSASLVYYQWD